MQKMSNDYLGDTNFASALFVTARVDNPKAVAFGQKISARGGRIYLSRIAVAEIEYGLAVASAIIKPLTKQQMEAGIKAYQVLEIGKHTSPKYAEIRSELFKQKAPKDKKGKIMKGLRPESFTALIPTAQESGIQENDLWMAAIAVERNMILITADRMNQLKSVFPTLKIEDWKS